MGKYIIIILLLLSTCISAQDEFHKLAIGHSFGSMDDGYSVGLLYEHQNKVVYYGGELYIFPDLHDMDYAHLIGRFGFNTFLDMNQVFRIYAGGRAGRIYRDGSINYALLGIEAGGNIFILDKFFIGGYLARDMKTDSKSWGSKDHHMVNSVIFIIGLKF